MYVCPNCKSVLDRWACRRCSVQYPVLDGIPCFIRSACASDEPAVCQVYDAIYRYHRDAWVDQGRSEPFIAYVAHLAQTLSRDRVLEVGCGEGALLAAMVAAHKAGVDPSLNALVRARCRSAAECAVARAECLPFPDRSFDLVVTVGVMEHFEDPDAATREIGRVLSDSGHYLALIQTESTLSERIRLKLRQYFFPRFRPVELARWMSKKVYKPIVQPFYRPYTIASARECIERGGLEVAGTISGATHPDAPLAGPHVVIFMAAKAAGG